MTRHPTQSSEAGLPKLATLYPKDSRDHSRRDAATHPTDLALRRSTGYRYVLASAGPGVVREQEETHDAHSRADAPFDERMDWTWTKWGWG